MNRFKRGFSALVLIGGLIAFMPSCTTVKPVVFRNLKPMSFDSLFHEMNTHQVNFSSLNAKVAVSYNKKGSDDATFRVQVRIQKDSLIWASIIPAMGIEAARAELTPDSLKLLNRMKKNYMLGDYRVLDSLLHTSVNYSVLQSLLVGNDLSGYRILSSKAETDREGYLITLHRESTSSGSSMTNTNIPTELTQKIWLDPNDFKIRKQYLEQQTTDHDTKELWVYYDTYQNIQGQLLPEKMRIVLNSRPKTEIFLTFKKIDLNKTYGFPFYIPEDYTKLF
ncbi:MAG: DUF4292 domain-containing protein [Bacteroidales bacterium]|nr:DUF4292 domain-containing protein [Bacteroidales bacterium]